jgi:hypothetical protein
MKKNPCLLFVLTLVLFACNKSGTDNNNPDTGLTTSPETKSQFDNTNFGVYKGVIVGSSGYITFRINNGDNDVKGYLFMDDQKDTLTTTASIILGEPISNTLFTGKISSMKVSVNADGSNAMLSDIQINGHNNVTGFIIHEKSTNQVLCYEGTFNGTATGIINATKLANGDTTYLLSKVYQSSQTNGTLVNINDTSLYRGFSWNYADSSKGHLWLDNVTYFNVNGKFSNQGSNVPTFNGTWSGAYGNGEFTTHRTY